MTAPDVTVRHATIDDLPGILAIFNDAVVNTAAIWSEILVDLADRRAWYDGRMAAHFPVLVASTAAMPVAGYASYGPFRPQPGYLHTSELSVYVDATARGQGIGDRLMGALVEEARRRGVHVLVGAIDADNGASIALHRRHGFIETGRMPEVGTKFGRWLTLVLMQLRLADGPPG